MFRHAAERSVATKARARKPVKLNRRSFEAISHPCVSARKIEAMNQIRFRSSTLSAAVLGGALLLAPTARAQNETDLAIGVAAPLSGSYEILGKQVAAGAASAAKTLSVSDKALRTIEADTRCTAEGGTAAAQAFVSARVSAVVGFLCAPALEAGLPILTAAGIPVIDVGVRVDRITDNRDKSRALVWRVAPRSDAEGAALADYVSVRWASVPFAIVEDGSVYGRDLADAVRDRLEERGTPPTLVDNFRPAEEKQFALARRIAQSGVTNIMVLGSRSDVAVIARDAASLGSSLAIVGGESLVDEDEADLTLPDGVVALASAVDVAPPDNDGENNRSQPAEPPTEGYFDPTFAAVEIVAEALQRSRADGGSLTDVLDAGEFRTRLGTVRFDGKGDGSPTVFKAYVWRKNRFVPQAGS